MRSLRFTNTKPWDFQGLETVYDLDDDMVIESVEGLGYPDMQISSQQAPFQDGESHLDQTFRPREIVVTAALRVVSLADVTTKKREISKKLSPAGSGFRQTSNSVNSPMDTYLGTLSYASDGSTYDRHIDCIVRSLVFTNRRYTDGLQRLRISFHCPSPFWYGAEVTETLELSRNLPDGNYYGSIYANSLFVAVGTTIAKSSNGQFYDNIYGPQTDILYDITYASSLFVAVGNNSCITSADAITWASKSIGTGNFQGIAHNGTVFCAVGLSGVCSTSTDGTTWAPQTIPAGDYYDISWNGSVFCAVGTSGVCATSADGASWTAQTIGAGSHYGITWNGTVFCVVGSNIVKTSPTGVTWTTQSAPLGSYSAITWDGTLFIAVTNSTGIGIKSSNGITWVQFSLGSLSYETVMASSSVFIFLGSFGAGRISKDQLSTLSELDIGLKLICSGIKYFNHLENFKILDRSNIHTTVNGVLTTAQSTIGIGDPLKSIAYNGSTIYIATNGTAIYSSSDLSTFTARLTETINDVVYDNGLFIAVGSSGTIIYYSTNGTSWSTATGASGTLNSICYGANIFVTVGESNKCFTSIDGITWTSQTIGTGNWNKVIFTGSLFVAVGDSNKCATSPDGITWTSRTIGTGDWLSVTYGQGIVIAVGNSIGAKSVDNGITWTALTVPAKPFTDIETNGFIFLAITLNEIAISYGNNFFSVDSSFYAKTITLTADTSSPIMAEVPIVGNESSKVITLSNGTVWDGTGTSPSENTLAISTTGLAAGTVDIDTTFGKKSVTTYGNKIMSKILGGYFWSLSPGDNYVNVRNSGSPADAPTITYRPRYLGV